MRREGIQLSRRLRITFYTVFGALFLTGAGWWAFALGASRREEPSVFQPWLLKGHGAAAMLTLFVLGVLYPLHVARGWRARRNRLTGAGLVAVSILLILSGYLLYYSGGETTRTLASRIHTWVGLALPLLVVIHILRGRALRVGRDK